jgi:hypothetical protein
MAGGVLASLIVAGCASQVVPTTPPAATLPTSTPASTAAVSPSGSSQIVPGGCGSTQVFAGPGPDAVGPDAIPGLEALRWAEATPAEAGIAAYSFRPAPEVLVVQPSPSGPSNKILWVTDGGLGANLDITAHPDGSASPSLHFSFPAAGRDYPSEIDLPTPGCWELDLGSTGAAMDLLVGPTGQGDGASPSAPWWAVGGLSACGRPAVSRVESRLTYLGGCDASFGEPPAVISLAVGELLDLHMTPEVIGGPPLYPLPTSTDAKVVKLVATQDAGTATYQAIGVGDATLLTNGSCSSTTVSQFNGPCPVVQIHVASP